MTQPTTLAGAPARLTDVQRRAVSWNTGTLLVLAGPGSGKTRVLTTRIARILRESPDRAFRVVALTFTNRAADEMRNRIERMAPEARDRLFIGTFHAFSADLLRQHGQHLGIKTDFRIYSTDDDRAEIVRRTIVSDKGKAADLTASDTGFLSLVDRAKAQLIPSAGIAERFKDAARGKKFEAFYDAYDAELAAANALDFNSLVKCAYEIFHRFPALAARYRSAYRYWCVDEFQDTNQAQYHLLKAMAGDDFRNIFAVADDDQIIYQWNGANYRRLDQFRQDFDADILQMPTNFRCPAEVVTCANNLIGHNLLRGADRKPLIAGKDPVADSSVIEILKFSTAEEEAQGIAQHIADNRKDALGRTAVLARPRRLLQPVADQLARLGMAAQVVSRRDEFQSAEFNWMHNALRLAVHKTDQRVLAAFVGGFNEMFACTLSTAEIIARSEADRVDLFTGWTRLAQIENVNSDALELTHAAAKLNAGFLDHARFAASVISVFKRRLTDDKPEEEGTTALSVSKEDNTAWHALSREAGGGSRSGLESFLQGLDLRSKNPPVEPNTVSVMTIHGAKGSEFHHIYLIGLAEDVLPGFHAKKIGDQSAQFEEERRNTFVAITRCQKSLTLSYAERYSGWPKEPSRFLAEMGLNPPA